MLFRSVAIAGAGAFLAWLIYQRGVISAQQIVQALALPHTYLQRRYYIDEIYAWYVERVQQRLIAGACHWFENAVIIGFFVNGIARLTRAAGLIMRRFQTGRVQSYVLVFIMGVVVLLAAALMGGRP